VTGVILQPSYIPWRGYFHLIQRADVFVFYDDVQYDKHGWRNRNRVKTPSGVQWLTIPVRSRGCVTDGTPIKDIEIAWDRDWAAKHWATIRQSYARRAPHFARYGGLLEQWYAARPALLADAVIPLTITLARELGITHTRFVRSSELGVTGDRVERLLGILRAVGADRYLSGPSAQEYIDEEQFQSANIGLSYVTYDYREYTQLYPPYDPQVSILDLLFMTGPDAPNHIWGPADPSQPT
jgi:hypothetical protein